MISTLWSIRTEVLMLEECLSTVTVASLTRKIKDTFVDESVRFAGDDETNVVENASEDSDGFHSENPFFPWRSSLGVMPYALGVTMLAGNPLSVAKQWTLRILFRDRHFRPSKQDFDVFTRSEIIAFVYKLLKSCFWRLKHRR